MKTLAALISVGTLGIFLGCSTDSEDPRSIAGNKYDNRAIGMSIQFPANWQLKLDQKFGELAIDLVALGPAVQNFSPNVTVIIGAHAGGAVDWNKSLAAFRSQLQAQIPDLGSYEDTVLVLDGKQYAELKYTTRSQGNLMKIRQNLFLNQNKEITVTFTDLAARFDQNADFASINASVKLD